MDQVEWELCWAGYRTLIEYLAQTYGPEVIPALLDDLSQVHDIDTWLRLATGHGVDEIEPAWRAWVWATYGGAGPRADYSALILAIARSYNCW